MCFLPLGLKGRFSLTNALRNSWVLPALPELSFLRRSLKGCKGAHPLLLVSGKITSQGVTPGKWGVGPSPVTIRRCYNSKLQFVRLQINNYQGILSRKILSDEKDLRNHLHLKISGKEGWRELNRRSSQWKESRNSWELTSDLHKEHHGSWWTLPNTYTLIIANTI